MSATIRILVSNYGWLATRSKIDNLLLEKIDLDRAMTYLIRTGALSDMERHILAVSSVGHSNTSGAKELGISKREYVKLLRTASQKIAKFLGWEYADTRIAVVAKARLGRELTEEEVESLEYFFARYSANYSEGVVLSETD